MILGNKFDSEADSTCISEAENGQTFEKPNCKKGNPREYFYAIPNTERVKIKSETERDRNGFVENRTSLGEHMV